MVLLFMSSKEKKGEKLGFKLHFVVVVSKNCFFGPVTAIYQLISVIRTSTAFLQPSSCEGPEEVCHKWWIWTATKEVHELGI